MNNELTLTFPDTPNGKWLFNAVAMALEDEEFMVDEKRIEKATDSLTPKDDVTKAFKQLQRYGYSDYLKEKDAGNVAEDKEAKEAHIKDYVHVRFKKYMTNQKTSIKATRMFNRAYPDKTEEPAQTTKTPEEGATNYRH